MHIITEPQKIFTIAKNKIDKNVYCGISTRTIASKNFDDLLKLELDVYCTLDRVRLKPNTIFYHDRINIELETPKDAFGLSAISQDTDFQNTVEFFDQVQRIPTMAMREIFARTEIEGGIALGYDDLVERLVKLGENADQVNRAWDWLDVHGLVYDEWVRDERGDYRGMYVNKDILGAIEILHRITQ